MTKLRSQFAERLKVLRIEKKLTQEELAKIIGLSTSFVSSLERGINAPSFESIEKLAEALNVEVKELFEFGPESQRI